MKDARLDTLTLSEKTSLLTGAGFWETAAIAPAGVPSFTLTDGPHGVRKQDGSADHLGINDSLPSTAFPTASATGSTWDRRLLERMGEALGREGRTLGADVLLGPGINIKRSPLCGRNFEYFSEDPLLSGQLGAAWVRGVQTHGVGASVKHFAVNNQETDRQRVSAEVDERTLREIYLAAFETVVKESDPATVMCSYNRINGVPAAEHRWLLTDVLRGEWGFRGYVLSDWGAVTDPVASVEAGMDLAMPQGRGPEAIAAAVDSGRLGADVVDAAVDRIAAVHERLLAARDDVQVDWEEHHRLAREIAAAGAVLLENAGGILPLDADDGAAIAVIGEFARTPRYQGAGSSHINPTRLDDALTGIRTRTSREVLFAPGFSIDDEADVDEAALRAEAVEIASRAAVTVLFLGLPPIDESEGYDRTHLALPAGQLRMLEAVLKVTQQVVVVLSNGGVVSMDALKGRVPAVLEMWLSGQAGGSATADVLFGDREPGGRLAETIPLRLEDTPAFVNWPGSEGRVRYGERVYVGYRWYDRTVREVAYPFGHGLGYTSFAYRDLTVAAADEHGAHVEVTVENTGPRRGAEVVQVYVSDLEASVDRPLRELVAFDKVELAPGEAARVVFDLTPRAFAFWSAHGWLLESGEFEIAVGHSSRDLRERAIVLIEVPGQEPILDVDSTLGDWVAHEHGRSVLEQALSALHPQAANLTSGETLRLASSIPLRTLMGMSGADDPDALVATLLARVG